MIEPYKLINCLQKLHSIIRTYGDCLEGVSEGKERDIILDLAEQASRQARKVRELCKEFYGVDP